MLFNTALTFDQVVAHRQTVCTQFEVSVPLFPDKISYAEQHVVRGLEHYAAGENAVVIPGTAKFLWTVRGMADALVAPEGIDIEEVRRAVSGGVADRYRDVVFARRLPMRAWHD